MTEAEIFERLAAILKNEIHIAVPISKKTALIGENIIDSMDMISYITRVEETFDIKISDQDLEQQNLGVMQNMVAFLQKKTG